MPIPATAFGARHDSNWIAIIESALKDKRDVIAHTTRGPRDARLASGATAEDVGAAIGAVAARMAQAGLTRDVVICGGDTSSHALARCTSAN